MFINWRTEKINFESSKHKDNLIIFVQKLVIGGNLNNNFKSKRDKYYFRNYKEVIAFVKYLKGVQLYLPNLFSSLH